VTDREGVSVEEQVAMFLHVVSHNQRFRVVHHPFRRSIQTVHKHFHQIMYAVGELRNEIMKAPSSGTHPKVLGSPRWNPYLKVIVYLGFISCSYSLVLISHMYGF
jgi:hypothetical protein